MTDGARGRDGAAQADGEDLVDLLLACHQRIRRFVRLAHTAATHPDASSGRIGEACAEVERYFRQALPLHVADEEESIAPRLRGRSPEVDRALATMERQHQDHGPQVEALLQASGQVRRCPGRQGARDALAAAARRLEAAFAEHLGLEERVIFPAIRELLSREVQGRVVEELRLRRREDRPQPPG